MNSSPCQGCEERSHGCHDHCIAYKKWHGEVFEQKEKMRQCAMGLVAEQSQLTVMTRPKKGGRVCRNLWSFN